MFKNARIANNKNMILMIVILLILLFLLVVFYPFSVISKTYFNPIKNRSFVFTKVGFFVVACYMIQFEKSKLYLTNIKGKSKELKLKTPTKKQALFISSLVSKLKLVSAFAVFKGGVKDDAFKTAMLCGVASSGFSVLTNFLKNNSKAIINYKIDTNYKEDNFTLALDLKIRLSLFNLFSAFIIVFFKLGGIKIWKTKKTPFKTF